MRVIAKRKGFYKGSRVRAGQIFDMAESAMKKVDGKTVLPGWVDEVKDEASAKKQVADAKAAEATKARDAAVAASGGAAAKKRREEAEQLV